MIENRDIRTDYEFIILEGQKMSDVFHEVSLPTRNTGSREVCVVIVEDKDTISDEDTLLILKTLKSELEDWGFLDKDLEHTIKGEIIPGPEHLLQIYTT